MPVVFLHIPRTGGTSIRTLLGDSVVTYPEHPVPQKQEDDYVFCFVRSPYTRAVSLYNGHSPAGYKPDFSGFLERVRKGTWSDQYRCNPQAFWTTGCPPNFIGRFESFQLDFDTLADILGWKYRSLPYENSAKAMRMAEMSVKALTQEHKEMIEEIYKDDFDTFGYLRGDIQ